MLLVVLAAGACSAERPSVVDGGEQHGAQGAEVFATQCAQCHAVGGEGLPQAPDLTRSPTAAHVDQVEQVVRHGQGVMPAFDGTLSDAEMEAVATYVAGELAGRIDLDSLHELPTVPEV